MSAFSWGFTIRDVDITLRPPEPLRLERGNRHTRVLRRHYPRWLFSDVSGPTS